MNFREEFNLSIRARCAVLYVTTREEERLLSVVKDCAAELENMRVVSWDFASGFDVGVAVGKGNPIAVLDFIAKEPADTPILYVLKDFHRFLEDNMVCRMVKNLAAQLKPQQKSILIVSPVYKVPEELTSSVSVLEFQLPTLPELREYITNITQNVVVDMDKEGFEQFVRAFQGLTISTVKTILSKALARSGKISLNDLQLVLEEKKQVIRKTQVLEFFNAEETMGSIGGMDVLKSWIITRGMAFSEQAQQFGLPYPKGVLIVGIQGTGKSLCAKAISQQWHMPLLRLDVGRLMGSYVGESEARTREMIQIAEAMAPCVLWIDEVDKGFAGIGGVQGDSGAQARVSAASSHGCRKRNPRYSSSPPPIISSSCRRNSCARAASMKYSSSIFPPKRNGWRSSGCTSAAAGISPSRITTWPPWPKRPRASPAPKLNRSSMTPCSRLSLSSGISPPRISSPPSTAPFRSRSASGRPSISSLPGRAAAGPVWPAASRRPMNPPRATSCITAIKTAQGMASNEIFRQ